MTTTPSAGIVTVTGDSKDECSGSVSPSVQKDIDEGQELHFGCGSGCLKIEKALYSCPRDMNVVVPEHLSLLKEKCEGKQSCVAQSCGSFWNSDNLKCDGAVPRIWVNYKLRIP